MSEVDFSEWGVNGDGSFYPYVYKLVVYDYKSIVFLQVVVIGLSQYVMWLQMCGLIARFPIPFCW